MSEAEGLIIKLLLLLLNINKKYHFTELVELVAVRQGGGSALTGSTDT